MPKTTPAKSEGARYERKAIRAYLRRQLNATPNGSSTATIALRETLAWVLTRQKRYDKKAGGL